MHRFLGVLILLVMALSVLAQNIGRRQSRYGFEVDVKPRVYFDSYIQCSADDWKPLLRIRLKIQYDILQFTKVNNTYQALYDVSLLIKEPGSDVAAFSTGWQGSVIESDFDKTNAIQIFQCDDKVFDLPLKAGSYTIFLEVTDRATRTVFIENSKIEIRKVEGKQIEFSEIKFVSPQDSLSAEIHIKAEYPILEFDQPVLASFDIYSNHPDSLKIVSQLMERLDGKDTLIKEHTQTIYSGSRISAFYEPVQKNDLKEGLHLLRYTIQAGEKSVRLEREFKVVWYAKPVYLYEFDLAWRPLKAILPAAEWDTLNNLSSTAKNKWYDDFWRRKDPTPETPLNEIQYEFYSRVDQANIRYSMRFKEGWQTDRGQTLLSYGSPDSIETFRYSPTVKPHEIWYYYSLRKKLTFVDVDRDENYKLSYIEAIEERRNE